MRFNTLFLFILLSSLFAVTAQANGIPTRDSIPRIDYIGYRLYLTHFELVKQKKGYLYVKLSAINTGNKNMSLGKGAAQVFPVVKFDESIGAAGLSDFQTEIYFKLLEEKASVPIGGISTNIELKLLADAADSKLNSEEPKEEISATEEIVEVPVSEPEPEAESIPVATQVEKSPEPVALIEEPLTVETAMEEAVATTEIPVEVPLAEEPVTVEEDACADLLLQNVTIVKRSKNSVTLQYELVNRGIGTATLVKGHKKNQESIAIRAHLSSSEKLTRGAIVLESNFLHGDEISLKGGETYAGQLKLSLHKLTKFTPVLILELDAYEFVAECDEHNNLSRVQLLDNP